MITQEKKQLFLKTFITTFNFAVFTFYLQAQSYLQLSVENDLFFLTDHYYSSGILISHGIKKDNKTIHWRLGQEIFTPKKRFTDKIKEMDYPFSGWLFIQREMEVFWNDKAGWSWGMEIGITGKASLAKNAQNLYHKITNIHSGRELSWIGAQPQRLHFGVFGQVFEGYSFRENMHFTGQLFGKASTHRIHALGRFGILIGKHKKLPFQKAFFHTSNLSRSIYIGTMQEYRPHDFVLSGSLFDNTSEFTVQSLKYRHAFELGFFSQKKNWTVSVLYRSMSKDTPLQMYSRHRVLNITLRHQF
ncbi:MAG: hypothetical protein CMC79_03195 [Flavobacteriaceae bacterium]|nr:hypothetical protein [Flavobacteriaceae bacterium]